MKDKQQDFYTLSDQEKIKHLLGEHSVIEAAKYVTTYHSLRETTTKQHSLRITLCLFGV